MPHVGQLRTWLRSRLHREQMTTIWGSPASRPVCTHLASFASHLTTCEHSPQIASTG